MSKRKKERRQKRSVAGATARRREHAEKGYSEMFALPKGTEMYNVESTGIKRIDIIPYVVGKGNPNADEGDLYWERTFFAHRNVGVNNEMVVCPARTAKKKCPICEYQAKLQRDPEADEETVKALSPSKRMLLNVRNMKKDPDKVKVWHISHWYFGKAIDEALAAAYEDHEDNMDNFCDPEGGHYLKCVAEAGYEGQGYNIARVDFIPRKEDLDDDILEQAPCLDDVLVVKDYDELKDMFLAGADEDEDEDEKLKAKKGKGKKQKDEDDEDDEDDDLDADEPEADEPEADDDIDDDDDDDEPEEDVKPKTKKVKKTKKSKPKKVEEDEDEDEDEDWEAEDDDTEAEDVGDEDDWDDLDDDEDEEPKSKKKSKKRSK
jgi:hypothetical protein